VIDGDDHELPPPPGSWSPALRLAQKALGPVESFLAVEAGSGIVLMAAAALALIWANSPWAGAYAALWHAPVGVSVGPFSFSRDLHFWINDGLMTIFFFVVGLEIRREIHRGELSELRRAALPLAAAVGGMAAPACIFFLLNQGRTSSNGWGVPMATDIAFAVGVLALLGKRVPPALRVLLLALAVIDDVGAIIVIAVFYSSGIVLAGFVVAGIGFALVLGMQALGVRSAWAYVIPGVVVWAGAYAAGIHPTLAGVAIGLMTPVRAWLKQDVFIERAKASVSTLRGDEQGDERVVLAHLEELNHAGREAVAPLARIEHALHRLVAFGIMPLFALANAGVPLGSATFEGDSLLVFAGVLAGLVVGKPLGILGLSWLLARAGLVALPTGITWRQVALVGVVGGIGFTMALFIAELALPDEQHLKIAKLAILLASVVAAVVAFVLGRVILATPGQGGRFEAERSANTSR
jgi:NhaA family Na+:H+ antiporter